MAELLRRTVLRPWTTGATWRAQAHLALDLPIGTLLFGISFSLVVTAASLVVVVPAAIAVAWLAFVVAHGLADIERSRFAALLDVHLVDAHPTLEGSNVWRRFTERLRSGPRWREIAYTIVVFPVGLLTSVLSITVWSTGIALVLAPLLAATTDAGTLDVGGATLGTSTTWALPVLGVAVLAVGAPWTTVLLARLDVAIGRALLGRSERAEFERKVTTLETQRNRAVDSAEAERRRIERDLHDGAQQRLIAVAMQLGVARQRLDDDPAAARELVGEAHDEVKSALKELRDLVRGIHPVILEDRGLDAALSAVVARCAVPVDLRVDVDRRPPPAVESAAYFIVSEALVNVQRHADAGAASVEIVRRGDRLTIVVADDGRGGADPTGGSGLAGLADRVAGLDGWMQVVSPVGGPTTLMVEVPCGS